jgi:hypothetical protein
MLTSSYNSKRYIKSRHVLTYTDIYAVHKETELIKMELVAEFNFVH